MLEDKQSQHTKVGANDTLVLRLTTTNHITLFNVGFMSIVVPANCLSEVPLAPNLVTSLPLD